MYARRYTVPGSMPLRNAFVVVMSVMESIAATSAMRVRATGSPVKSAFSNASTTIMPARTFVGP